MTRKASIIAFIALIIIAVASLCICYHEMQSALHFFKNIDLPTSPFNALYIKTLEFVAHVFDVLIMSLWLALLIALLVLAIECACKT